jgi:hypothetical protein
VPAHIIDRCRYIPFNPKVLAPVPPYRPVQMARHLFSTRNEQPARTVLVARFFCVGAEAQIRVKGGRSCEATRIVGRCDEVMGKLGLAFVRPPAPSRKDVLDGRDRSAQDNPRRPRS